MTKENKRKLLGRLLVITSVGSRTLVLTWLSLLAWWTEYLNLKLAYNLPRLVELARGKTWRLFYEYSESFFSLFGEPDKVMQTNGGMPWSLRFFGMPITDPTAASTFFFTNGHLPSGFAFGLLVPVGIALIFGRVFCSWVCPASLFFFSTARLRRMLQKFFWLPDLDPGRGVAWGIFLSGLISASFFGFGIWMYLLPYLALGQSIFNGFVFGALSTGLVAIAVFVVIDLVFGKNFSCRYLCPTGRILAVIGQKAPVKVRRDAEKCLTSCQACTAICPLKADAKTDKLQDCSLCGECLVACPTSCLTIGVKEIS